MKNWPSLISIKNRPSARLIIGLGRSCYLNLSYIIKITAYIILALISIGNRPDIIFSSNYLSNNGILKKHDNIRSVDTILGNQALGSPGPIQGRAWGWGGEWAGETFPVLRWAWWMIYDIWSYFPTQIHSSPHRNVWFTKYSPL